MSKVYRLGSSPMVFTPNLLRWAISGYKFPDQRKTLLNIFTDGFDLPSNVAKGLLSGKTPYRVEDDVVVVLED